MNKAKTVAERLKKVIDQRNAKEREGRHTNILPPYALTTIDDMGSQEWINAMDGIYKLSIDDIVNRSPRFLKAQETVEYEYYRLRFNLFPVK